MSATETRRIDFLSLLRGPAALMVLWDHLGAIWPSSNGIVWAPLNFVRRNVNEPFGIIQDFGWLGVCLFFLVSGFVISHVQQRERAGEFLVRRVFRIYPPLAAAFLIFIAFDPDLMKGVTLLDAIRVLTLTNYFALPQVVVVGVAWTLAIEMLFYLMVLLFYRAAPPLLIAFELVLIAIVIAYARSFGDNFFLVAASVAYLPYLVIGQILYFGVYARSLPPALTFVSLAATAGVMVFGIRTIHSAFMPLTNSYLVSFAWAFGIFLFCLVMNSRIKLPRISERLADMSYSLYLVHGPVGMGILAATPFLASYTLRFLVATAVALLVSHVLFVLVERPSQTLGKRISARLRSSDIPGSGRRSVTRFVRDLMRP